MSFASDFEATVLPDIYAALGETVSMYRCVAGAIGGGGAAPHLVTGMFLLTDATMTDGDRAIDTTIPTFEAPQRDLDALGVVQDTWSLDVDGARYDVMRYNRLDAGVGQLYLRRMAVTGNG